MKELKINEMMETNGGGIGKAILAGAGTFLIGTAPAVGVGVGIGGSVVGTPVIGVAAGTAAASGQVAAGATLLDYANNMK